MGRQMKDRPRAIKKGLTGVRGKALGSGISAPLQPALRSDWAPSLLGLPIKGLGRLQTQGSRRRKCQLEMLPFMLQERQTYAPAPKNHRVFSSMWERLPLVHVNRARVEGDRQLHPERSDWQVAAKGAG